MTRENSRLLGYMSVYHLYKAVEDIYKALCDDKIVFSENLALLLNLVAEKIAECCNLIETKSPELEEVDVLGIHPDEVPEARLFLLMQ